MVGCDAGPPQRVKLLLYQAVIILFNVVWLGILHGSLAFGIILMCPLGELQFLTFVWQFSAQRLPLAFLSSCFFVILMSNDRLHWQLPCPRVMLS